MSGGNYHITLTELLESEKKLKAVSLLKLKSSQAGEFSIKQLCLENSGENELFTDELEDESALLDCNVEDDVKKYETSENENMALIYIEGMLSLALFFINKKRFPLLKNLSKRGFLTIILELILNIPKKCVLHSVDLKIN